MFVIHLEGYLADSIKRQLWPLLQYQCATTVPLHWWP